MAFSVQLIYSVGVVTVAVSWRGLVSPRGELPRMASMVRSGRGLMSLGFMTHSLFNNHSCLMQEIVQ